MRLYAWRLKTRHMKFLDLADSLGLVVSFAFEMGTAMDTPLSTPQDRAIAYGIEYGRAIAYAIAYGSSR